MKKVLNKIFTSFHIDTTEVAIPVSFVQEVVNFPERIVPMPLAPDFLLGVFNLRGMIIPVVNLKKLLKYPDASFNNFQKVAIVDVEGAKVGLVFDSTSEILRVADDDVSDFGYVSEASHRVIRGAIKLEDGARILQVLDCHALIKIENVPQILDQQKIILGKRKDSRLDQRNKCISFSMTSQHHGTMKMAIEISDIHEIVKVPEIRPSSIQSDIFLGIINLRGITVPVMSFAKILKMHDEAASNDITDHRIIILKIGTELIGMVVDSVECINSYYKDDIMAVPLLSADRISMFTGCIDVEGQGEIFLLSYEHILSNKEILEVTEGHSKIYQMAKKDQVEKKISHRESYISFRLDHLFGISIKDIKEIINYSEDIISAPGMPHYVKGMLNLRSHLVTIIDTRDLYKMQGKKEITTDSKVLIFEKGSEKFGLIVDSLESILTIEDDKKFKVPSLVTGNIQKQFQDDIKEIVSVPMGEKEGALIILNMKSVTGRIQSMKAAS